MYGYIVGDILAEKGGYQSGRGETGSLHKFGSSKSKTA